ncbi:acetyl-CoA carboxylase biotin carboxyl carrier protein subunit [Melioribacteraceae bacterium 4301-Me]|uniref:acetyl-CoA carboxylase biotin carboxyl carrier protein subunit n=1 Tax=Pyranulibacter aquaticus TaxID=3163344 RepID=UPI00359B9730
MNEFIITNGSKKITVDFINANQIKVNGKIYEVRLKKINDYFYLLTLDNITYEIACDRLESGKFGLLIKGNYYEIDVKTKLEEMANDILKKKDLTNKHNIIKAPMPGLILKVNKHKGDEVKIGEPLFLLEAMKMENEIRSPVSGVVKELKVKEGQSVSKDEIIMTFE